MYFVPHYGHAKVYETSIWTPCFQILAKTMGHFVVTNPSILRSRMHHFDMHLTGLNDLMKCYINYLIIIATILHFIFSGYLVFYTTNNKQTDREWVVEGVLGDKLSAGIRELTPDTTYYFKVQARNRKGYGPMSPTVIFRTPLGECPIQLAFDNYRVQS